MALITTQKIAEFYERYKNIDVTYSKEIINVTRLVTAQVYLKCGGDFFPCVLYSTSFIGAKVAANTKSGMLSKLQQTNNSVSLKLCFQKPDVSTPVTFFISGRIGGYAPYGNSQDIALFSIQFNQRPPDDFIEIVGKILDANVNSAKRREERLLVTPDMIRKLNLMAKETALFIQGVPRRCILRDISFSGAKVIMMGVAKFLVNRDVALRLDFDDPRESFNIKGMILRTEDVEGRKDLIALAIHYTDNTIPMGYKVRLNDYLSSIKVDRVGIDLTETAAPKPAAASKSAAATPKPTAPAPAAPAPTPAAAPKPDDPAAASAAPTPAPAEPKPAAPTPTPTGPAPSVPDIVEDTSLPDFPSLDYDTMDF